MAPVVPPTVKTWRPGRSVVMGRRGIAATSQPLASLEAIRVLQAGGNAVDAAICAAAVTGVTLPMMCGLGGDAFILHYEAATRRVTGITGSGVGPRECNRDWFLERGMKLVPIDGPLSISVPGAVHAYETALKRWGTMSLRRLFEPAIYYAEEGFPVPERTAASVANAAAKLARFPTSAAIYLPEGRPVRAGDVLRNPDLGRSLRLVAEGGSEAFYRGPIAREISSFLRANGGMLGLQEFEEHQSEIYDPIHIDYRGHTVYETNPPSQGLVVLEELNLVEGFDLAALGHNTAESIHLMVEAKKLAFADRLRYLGDPGFVANPLAELTSKRFAARRRCAIDPNRAAETVRGAPREDLEGDTTYLCVVDGQGNAVSLIHSLSHAFGSGVVAGSTGIPMNNRLGRGFILDLDHPNCIAPGKRTMHTLNCYLICKDGKLTYVGGTPGGDQQPQWNLQVISNLLDYGMTVQQAVEAPRWHSFPSSDPHTLDNPFELRLEAGIDEEAAKALARRGHRVRRVGDGAGGGSVQLIQAAPDGVLMGGSDPRADGCAIAW